MGIRLEIAGENSEQFSQALHGVFGLLKMYAVPLASTEGQPVPTVGGDPQEVIAEAGPNPSVGEAPKRRGRPAKPPVTIDAVAEPAKVEATEVATGEPDPTSTALSVEPPAPTTADVKTAAPVPTAKKPTIDEARTALKAVAALQNGQELTYSVLSAMGVKTLTEAYLKDAEQLMTLCAAKMPAVAA